PTTTVPRPHATAVRPDGPAPAPPAALRDVRVIGDPGTAADVARALRALGADARTTGSADPAVDRPSAVVLCAVPSVSPAGETDGHPGTAHRIDHELVDHLLALGIPRQYCHREGAIVWIEPPALEPGDVTAAHVRARRLAATPAHRELAAHWRGAAVEEPAPPLSVETRALLASILAADLAEVCGVLPPDTALPPVRRRLRRLDSATGTVTTHPVFPVPAVAPLPIPRKASA
ncbi:hypothetical protein, partial [Streptomyces sp. ST2-7A]|uniref:hypothetical protein n=1 Tax=Streptomyces sp. ST2-7A TaxID=2907214 RepID=UPI001F3ABF66